MGIFERDIILRCTNCLTNTTIDVNVIQVESSSGGERGMGHETIWDWEHSFKCNCSQEIRIKDSISEYPIGSFNFSDPEIEGAIFVETPAYSFHSDFDED